MEWKAKHCISVGCIVQWKTGRGGKVEKMWRKRGKSKGVLEMVKGGLREGLRETGVRGRRRKRRWRRKRSLKRDGN